MHERLIHMNIHMWLKAFFKANAWRRYMNYMEGMEIKKRKSKKNINGNLQFLYKLTNLISFFLEIESYK